MTRHVIYCAPFPGLRATHRFARALAGLQDLALLGLFQRPPTPEIARSYKDYEVVEDALDVEALWGAAQRLAARHGAPHRVVGILEDLQLQVATLCQRFGLPGGDLQAADRFRDKVRMKQALRAHSLPCAAHARVTSEEQAWAFASRVGFPLVLKPTAGAGCRATVRVDHAGGLRQALSELRPSPTRALIAEEFLSGREYSFETLTVRGEPVFHSIGRYLPGPLEVATTPWIQWVCVLPRDIGGPWFDEARRVGFAAVRALGMGSGMTHMEWFRRERSGGVAIGEIAMRPPGAQFVSLMGWAHDVDMYRAWARAVVDDAFDGPWDRGWAVAIAYLRGPGQGRVRAVTGLEQAQERLGSLVVEVQLPQIGAPKASGYEGDGYVILRDRETERVLEAARTLIETVQVHYQ